MIGSSTGGATDYYCPFPETVDLNAASVTSALITGQDRNNSGSDITTRACAVSIDGLTLSCSPIISVPGGYGYVGLTINGTNITPWTANPGFYKYVYIGVPVRLSGLDPSVVSGIYYAHT